MRAVFAIVLLAAAVSAAPAMTRLQRSHADIAAHVNSLNTSWQATAYPRFMNLTPLHIKKLMGTYLGPGPVTLPVKDEAPRTDIPASFDSRTQWGKAASPVYRELCSCGLGSSGAVLHLRIFFPFFFVRLAGNICNSTKEVRDQVMEDERGERWSR